MNERRWLRHDEASRLHAEMLEHAVPIRFAGPRRVDAGGLDLEVPLVQLDAAASPAVDDLFRVIAGEGHQPAMVSALRYLLHDGQGFMEINVVLSDPVSCAFKFVLQWPAHQDLFDLILMYGQVLFTTQALSREQRATILALKIPREELEPILSMWRRVTSGRTTDSGSAIQ